MRSPFYLFLLGIVLLTIALVVRSGMLASKHPDEPLNSAMRAAMAETAPQLSTEDATTIRRLYPTAYTTPSGLMYINTGPGTGTATPKVGDTIVANYAGRLLDGTTFDSSAARGHPITVEIGTGKVIKGWDEAILTMRKGAKRVLIVPYWLGYGDVGLPPVIPPRTTLVFDVELLDFH